MFRGSCYYFPMHSPRLDFSSLAVGAAPGVLGTSTLELRVVVVLSGAAQRKYLLEQHHLELLEFC